MDLTKIRKFMSECHFDVMSLPLNVGPATLTPGTAVQWSIPLPWRAKYNRFLSQVQEAPWWTNLSKSEMDETMNALMRAKIVLFDGLQPESVLQGEFATHIGHLSEYAPR